MPLIPQGAPEGTIPLGNDTQTGTDIQAGNQNQGSGEFGSNIPSGPGAADRSAPEVDELRAQIEDLQGRIDALRERPTQSELEDLRNRCSQAVQIAFRLGARNALAQITS